MLLSVLWYIAFQFGTGINHPQGLNWKLWRTSLRVFMLSIVMSIMEGPAFLSFDEVTLPTLPWWIAVGIIRSLLMFLECWSCNCNIYSNGIWSLLSQRLISCFACGNAAWYYVKPFLLWKLCWNLANEAFLAHCFLDKFIYIFCTLWSMYSAILHAQNLIMHTVRKWNRSIWLAILDKKISVHWYRCIIVLLSIPENMD
jgi:hypothetical protein